jgi:nucleotide sugar dehydrogenase
LFNPEFLTELTADQDMCYPDRQIIGYTKESYNAAGDILQILPLAPFERIMPATEAEMVKYYGNTWFATKVIFANQLYDLCQKLGIDYDRVMEAAAADKRIGRSHLEVWHKGYRGFGGKCLPKDLKAFIQLADEKAVDLKLHKTVDAINDELLRQQNISDPEKFSKRE